jgi:hypothetical protein
MLVIALREANALSIYCMVFIRFELISLSIFIKIILFDLGLKINESLNSERGLGCLFIRRFVIGNLS